MARFLAVTSPVLMLTMNAGIVGVLWFGGLRVIQGGMSIGQGMAFINYLMQTLFSMMMVSMLLIQVARATASAERIEEVMRSEPSVQTKPDALTHLSLRGRVVFEGVSFDYDRDGHDPALVGISFVVEPGQTVALLGSTGAGKSTLVHLIPRFYDVTAGRVTLDGVDVRDLDEKALRRSVSIALQETVLFSGTIRDNIRYGKPEATEEQVVAAARLAQAHDFITSFPAGYDTAVGQRGVNLSGGQKQRIAIARALLIEPGLLILDDSTSSVDVETEARLQEALADFRRGRSCIIIAQRISTVLAADQILVLDDGQIVASGTHSELLASSPLYREIYDSQLGNGVVANG